MATVSIKVILDDEVDIDRATKQLSGWGSLTYKKGFDLYRILYFDVDDTKKRRTLEELNKLIYVKEASEAEDAEAI
jgi:uncharacterized protein YlbG (UPF0298 family)